MLWAHLFLKRYRNLLRREMGKTVSYMMFVKIYLSDNGFFPVWIRFIDFKKKQINVAAHSSSFIFQFDGMKIWFVSSFEISHLKLLCLAKAVGVLRLLRHGRCRRRGHRRPTFHHFVAIDHIRNFLDDFNNSSIQHIDYHYIDIFILWNGIDVFNGFRDRDDNERATSSGPGISSSTEASTIRTVETKLLFLVVVVVLVVGWLVVVIVLVVVFKNRKKQKNQQDPNRRDNNETNRSNNWPIIFNLILL